MNYRSFTDLSDLIKSNLPLIQSNGFDLIVGVPRSGMIPAYMIALYLNAKCCDIQSFINNDPLKTGMTREANSKIVYPSEAENVLVVDDSINTGKSFSSELLKIPEEFTSKITTLAVYSSEKHRNDVNMYLEHVRSPRVFEWNIFHHSITENSCFNIDGVLCLDPDEYQNDGNGDGEYKDIILNATPLYIPSRRVNLVVTSRPEKYREETEAWLEKNGVKYNRLKMLDLPSKKRKRVKTQIKRKANIYKKSKQDLFLESDRYQALKIHELTKKPVYCVETNEMFSKGPIHSILHGSNRVRKSMLRKVTRKLPSPMYNTLRFVYHRIN